MYDYTGNNWSHRNSSKASKEKCWNRPGKHSTDLLQKTALLETSHIIGKVLKSEPWSLNWGNHRWFKRRWAKKKKSVTRKNNKNNLIHNNTNTTRFLWLIVSIVGKHIIKQNRFSVSVPISLQTESTVGDNLAGNCRVFWSTSSKIKSLCLGVRARTSVVSKRKGQNLSPRV